jgi:hypothetical protein
MAAGGSGKGEGGHGRRSTGRWPNARVAEDGQQAAGWPPRGRYRRIVHETL